MVVDHQTVTMILFWCKFGFGKHFGASSRTNHSAGHCQLSYKIHFLSHIMTESDWEMFHCCYIHEKGVIQNDVFKICSQFMGHSLSTSLQMLHDCSKINNEFFCNFSCNCKRISINDPLSWSSSTSYGWPWCSISLRLLSPLQNVLHHHCTVPS